MWDYLIKNGYVVDGTGAPWFKADLAIEGEKIAEINRRLPASKAGIHRHAQPR
jgi:N-acyl-D-aspartate/D-glutamate deacylase